MSSQKKGLIYRNYLTQTPIESFNDINELAKFGKEIDTFKIQTMSGILRTPTIHNLAVSTITKLDKQREAANNRIRILDNQLKRSRTRTISRSPPRYTLVEQRGRSRSKSPIGQAVVTKQQERSPSRLESEQIGENIDDLFSSLYNDLFSGDQLLRIDNQGIGHSIISPINSSTMPSRHDIDDHGMEFEQHKAATSSSTPKKTRKSKKNSTWCK